MPQIHIPVYGFAGLRLFLPEDLQKQRARQPLDNSFIEFRNTGTLGQSRRINQKRMVQQLTDRGVMERDPTAPFGEGFNISTIGMALLAAYFESKSPEWVDLDKFLMNCPQKVLDKLCGMPFLDDNGDEREWTTLFEALGIIRRRKRTRTYELVRVDDILEFFEKRPWTIPPPESTPLPSLTGARPIDQQETIRFQAQLQKYRDGWDGVSDDDFSTITNPGGTDEDDADFSDVFADSEDWDII